MKTKTKGLRRKLASRRGAAITFALLLFLVCATVGVIVLVAGTTASGRLSKLSETDRRYYAVQSAAQLLRIRYRTDENESWESVYTKEVTEELNPNVTNENWPTTVKESTITAVGTLGGSFLQEAAKKYILGSWAESAFSGLSDTEKASYWNQGYTPYGQTGPLSGGSTYSLTLEGAKDSAENPLNAADVTISAKLDIYGNLLVQLSSGEDENTYIVTMTFSPTDVPTVEYPELPTPTDSYTASGTVPPGAETDVAESVEESVSIVYNAKKQDVITWTFDGMTVGAENEGAGT